MNGPEIVRMNSELATKFGRIEARLDGCRDARELCERLVLESAAAFAVPFVWFSVLGTPEAEPLRAALRPSPLLRERLNVLSAASFLEICPAAPPALIASGDLRHCYRLLPPNVKYLIRSLAVAPLALHGGLIGSLNHGDPSADRYRPGMGTALLDHLAAMVSARLSELLPAAPDGSDTPKARESRGAPAPPPPAAPAGRC